MARRKKRRAVSGVRRRRSVSGTGSYQNALMMVAGAMGGGIASRMVATSVGKNLQPQLIALGEVGLGAWLAVSSNGPFMTGVGLGVATEGASFFLTKAGVIKGTDDEFYDEYGDIGELPMGTGNFTSMDNISGED